MRGVRKEWAAQGSPLLKGVRRYRDRYKRGQVVHIHPSRSRLRLLDGCLNSVAKWLAGFAVHDVTLCIAIISFEYFSSLFI